MKLRPERVIRIAGLVGASTALTLTLTLALVTIGGVPSPVKAQSPKAGDSAKQAKVKLGLAINDPKAFQGYTLLNTMNSKNAYLIDNQGRVVHTWKPGRNSLHCATCWRTATCSAPPISAALTGPSAAARAPSAGSRSSPGTASSSGTSSSSMTSSSPITTSASCPTATSC